MERSRRVPTLPHRYLPRTGVTYLRRPWVDLASIDEQLPEQMGGLAQGTIRAI